MAMYQPSPEKSAVKDRDNAKANVGRLSAKLNEAEQAVIACKTASQAFALSGDDAGLDVAEATERTALHRLDTLRAAQAEAGKLLALLETQIAETLDKKIRAATVAATNELADELIEAGAAYDASTALLAEVSTRALAVTMEANGLSIFTASSRIEVAAACEVVATCLREHGRSVLNHLAPAAMPKAPEPPAKVVVIEQPPLVRVFAVRPLKWLDETGQQRACGKFVDCDLPPQTAKRALASGVVLELSNPARKTSLGSWPGNYSLAACHDLDAAAAGAPPQHDPVVHSAFEPIDRGKPFQLRVAGSAS
jgi:hypothetical protein